MRDAPFVPAGGHVFVCVNRRPATDPLGLGCGERGDALYAATKRAVNASGRASSIWVTRTLCLGVCPKVGAAAALYPRGGLHTECAPEDAPRLLSLVSR